MILASISSCMNDLHYVLRLSRRAPLWTALVVVSLALGIGTTSAIFSFTNAVLLAPFPYRDAGRLTFIWGSADAGVTRGISGVDLEDWRRDSTAFEDMARFIDAGPVSVGLDASD